MTDTLTWRDEATYAAVIYQIQKRGGIPAFADDDWSSGLVTDLFVKMSGEGLIALDDNQWQLTNKGRTFYRNLLAALDQAKKFEIFHKVWITKSLADNESEDGVQCFSGVYDPRFLEDKNPGVEPEDLRIAMMTYVADTVQNDSKVDTEGFRTERVIFLQRLLDVLDTGNTADFWIGIKSGEFFQEVEDIANSAYQWQDLVKENEDEAWETAAAVYSAGMLQQQKIRGQECSSCGAPLALQESDNCCEECQASFDPPPPPPAEFECPACQHDIYQSESHCRGCGADINFSLPTGTIDETEEVVTEVIESYEDSYYDDPYAYVPYGYYDPFDPVVDALAFGILCSVLI